MKLTMSGFLRKMINRANHNVFCYSIDYAMTRPKDGFKRQWQEAKNELDMLICIAKIVEENKNTPVSETREHMQNLIDKYHKQKGDMTFNEIKHELTSRGITLNEIAKVAGVTVSCVYQTIKKYRSGQYKGRRIRPYIALALNKRVDEIWPDDVS